MNQTQPNVRQPSNKNALALPKLGGLGMGIIGTLFSTTVMAEKAGAQLVQNDQAKQAYREAAVPFVASNGGFAVTFEKYNRSTGQIISDFSGFLDTAPWDAQGTSSRARSASHEFMEFLTSGDTTVNRSISILNSNIGVRIVTGPNYINDRQLVIDANVIHIPAGANGTFDSHDEVAFDLARPVTGVGTFVPHNGTVPDGVSTVTVGNGFLLTVAEAQNGTFSPRNGDFSFYRANTDRGPGFVNGAYNDFTVFGFQPPLLNGKSTTGFSGAGNFLESSLVWDQNQRLIYGEFLGTNIGQTGNASPFGYSVITSDSMPAAASFNTYLNTVAPEPTAIAYLAGLSTILKRQRRTV